MSAVIHSSKYDAATRELAIGFVDSGTYSYFGVEPEVAKGLTEAESMGKFYNQNLRGKYATALRTQRA